MPDHSPSSTDAVTDAIQSRRSIRAFLKTPVSPEVIRELLVLAGRAPSGSNLQPWDVHVLTGATLARVGGAIQGAYLAEEKGHKRDYNYYTDPIVEPFLSRRRQCGWGLYGTLGIAKGEKERMKAQRSTNYNFFGAPLGLVFTIDRGLEKGSWLDYGMFLQTIMIAARAKGLHTCAQASIAEYPDIVRRELGIAEDRAVICGMGVGHPDPAAIINTFQPPRIALEEYARFYD
ncbi:MAG: nitroreductase [Burkholderiales bacterium]